MDAGGRPFYFDISERISRACMFALSKQPEDAVNFAFLRVINNCINCCSNSYDKLSIAFLSQREMCQRYKMPGCTMTLTK